MSISEVLCQISTFIAAGHETTSSALTWCLYALARDTDRQDRLRRELRALTERGKRDRGPSGGGSVGVGIGQEGVQAPVPGEVRRDGHWDEIKEEAEDVAHEALLVRICGCEYLDWVVREVLRVHAPITSTMRMCIRERDEIPVGKEGYVDRHGKRRWSIPIKRWDIVSVPIQAINKSTELWGEDAREFRCVSYGKINLQI
jgi:cytochrome P450